MSSLPHTVVVGLVRDGLQAWQRLIRCRALSWLWPEAWVTLHTATGQTTLCRGTVPAHQESQRTTRFQAVLLPPELVLQRDILIPALDAAQHLSALRLAVEALNPFESGDLTWTYSTAERTDSSATERVTLASRRSILRFLQERYPELDAQRTEIWVTTGKAESAWHILPGFGEPLRQRAHAVDLATSLAMLVLALGLTGVLVITPSAQLYLRTQQAFKAVAGARLAAKPAVAQRERMIQAETQLTYLQEQLRKGVRPMTVLRILTDALPDDTYLQSLQIQGSKVNLTGQTADSASLMKTLGSIQGVREVRSPSPAYKPPGALRESFTIELVLEQSRGATS